MRRATPSLAIAVAALLVLQASDGIAQPQQPGADPTKPADQPAASQPDASQPSEGAESGDETSPSTDTPGKPAPAPADATGPADSGEEDIELLDISEQGIVFKGEGGRIVKIADFEQLSLDKLLAEDVVVTGGKREQQSWATLSTISTMTRKEIDSYPYFFLGDLLATMPGLDVRWGKMQRVYVGTRGLSGTALNSRMLLLWDGMPLNDPFTGELSAGHFVPLVDIERIEVIRGPGSTLYGANAYNGVVNIITGLDNIKQRRVTASLAGGSFLTSRVQASFREPGEISYGGSAEVFRSDGPFPVTTRARENSVERIKNDDVSSVALATSASYGGLRLSGRYVYGDRGRPGTFPTDSQGNIRSCDTCHNSASAFGQGSKYPATKTSCGGCHIQSVDRERVHRASVAASFNHDLAKKLKLSVNAYHNEWRTEYITRREEALLRDAVLVEPRLKQRTSGGETHVSHSYEDINSLVVGVEGRRMEVASDLMETPDGDDAATQSEIGAFIEDEIHLAKWLSLTAGARIDYNSAYKEAFSPRGGLLLTPAEGLAIKFAVGRAFRNPALSEQFVRDERGRYRVFGNPELNREWITSVEAGISYAMVDPFVMRFATNAFYNLASDLISFRAVGEDRATFFNIDSVTAAGAEADVEIELSRKPGLRWFANYSYQYVRTGDEKHLPYAPTNKINSGFRVSQGKFGALARIRFVDKRLDDLEIELPRFVTMDLAARLDVWHGLNLQLWVQNLADERYQESLGIPGAPRSLYVVLDYRPSH